LLLQSIEILVSKQIIMTTFTTAPQYEAFRAAMRQTGYDRFMYLTIFVNSDDNQLERCYKEQAEQHNQKIIDDPIYADAGFDLMSPTKIRLGGEELQRKIDFGVQCSAGMEYIGDYMRNGVRIVNYTTGYYMYPRSSLSNTSLRLANSVGIIDAGYRGNLIGVFDIDQSNGAFRSVDAYDRVVQICAPNLAPVFVNLVSDVKLLGPSTARGDGGFGSSGK